MLSGHTDCASAASAVIHSYFCLFWVISQLPGKLPPADLFVNLVSLLTVLHYSFLLTSKSINSSGRHAKLFHYWWWTQTPTTAKTFHFVSATMHRAEYTTLPNWIDAVLQLFSPFWRFSAKMRLFGIISNTLRYFNCRVSKSYIICHFWIEDVMI